MTYINIHCSHSIRGFKFLCFLCFCFLFWLWDFISCCSSEGGLRFAALLAVIDLLSFLLVGMAVGEGQERLVLLRVHQSPGVHFSLDSGSSFFRAGLGQLGTDQKPQTEERQAHGVSTNRGSDPPRNAGSLGAEQSDQHCCTRPERSACRSPPHTGPALPPTSPALGPLGVPSSLPTCQPSSPPLMLGESTS